MKKLLFFAVSALIAGASYCSSIGEKIVTTVTNKDYQLEQQEEQTLILEAASEECNLFASHRSHYSHKSHYSHRSHYSSR